MDIYVLHRYFEWDQSSKYFWVLTFFIFICHLEFESLKTSCRGKEGQFCAYCAINNSPFREGDFCRVGKTAQMVFTKLLKFDLDPIWELCWFSIEIYIFTTILKYAKNTPSQCRRKLAWASLQKNLSRAQFLYLHTCVIFYPSTCLFRIEPYMICEAFASSENAQVGVQQLDV